MKIYLVVEGDYESRPVGAFTDKNKAQEARAFYARWSSEDVRVSDMELDGMEVMRKVNVLAEKTNGKWEISSIFAMQFDDPFTPHFGEEYADFSIDLVYDKDQDWHREEALRVLRQNGCEDDSLAERFGVKED